MLMKLTPTKCILDQDQQMWLFLNRFCPILKQLTLLYAVEVVPKTISSLKTNHQSRAQSYKTLSAHLGA